MTISSKQVAKELVNVRRYLEKINAVTGDANLIKAKHIVKDLIKRLS